MKVLRLAFLAVLGALSTQTIAAANQDLAGFSDWSSPVNLGPTVNSSANDLQAALSDDAEVLFFSSDRLGSSSFGSDDLWMSKREKQT